jgi:hypothetical protein
MKLKPLCYANESNYELNRIDRTHKTIHCFISDQNNSYKFQIPY